ncbi:MAG: amidohydrolase family protein [Planctomycetota bacterium]
MKTLIKAAALALATLTAGAQDLTHKAPPQTTPIVLTGATVHTVSGETIPNGAVAFRDGRLEYVGPARAGWQRIYNVIELPADRHVYPGMFASATSLGLTEISSVRDTIDTRELNEFSPEVRSVAAVNPDSTLIPVARSNGILLAGVFPTGGVLQGRAGVIRMDGWTNEGMTVEPYAGLVLDWPRMRPVTAWWMTQSKSEQQKRIDENLAEIDAFFSEAEDYRAAREADETLAEDLRYEAVLPALPRSSGAEDQRPLMIQANDLDEITAAVEWAVRRGLRPIIVGGAEAHLATGLLSRHDVPVVLRGLHSFPRRSDAAYDESYTQPARLLEAGITFAIDSSEETGHVRGLPYEAAMAARHGAVMAARGEPGFTPQDAVRAITLGPAEIFGVADSYGSLERGKSATLIVTDGPILEIPTQVLHAFIDGREIDLSNKQTKLRDKYVDKYRQLNMLDD